MTMRSNKAIVNAAGQTITTAGLAAGGALAPDQAQKFIQQTFEATPLSGLVRHEMRKAKTGEIDKIGVGRRLLRKKTENTDDGYRSGVKHGKLEYACTSVRLPWEITEETLRENQDTVDDIKRKAKEAGERIKEAAPKVAAKPEEALSEDAAAMDAAAMSPEERAELRRQLDEADAAEAAAPAEEEPVVPDAIYRTAEPAPAEESAEEIKPEDTING